MSHLIEFLESVNYNFEALKEQFGVAVKRYTNSVVLNYDQIESPKSHPVVVECRGVIFHIPPAIENKKPFIICRPFDRFFNYGEVPDLSADVKLEDLEAMEKADGSLIKLYCDPYLGWTVASRGTAFGESNVGDHPFTFADLAWNVLLNNGGCGIRIARDILDPDVTYLFELTTIYNRVVTPYTNNEMVFLAARRNDTGEYVDIDDSVIRLLGARRARRFSFRTIDDCINASKELGGLEEGFVLYQDGVPRIKVKSPMYVTAHRIKGEGLTRRRICELVAMGEEEEYLAYFPDDRPMFAGAIAAKQRLEESILWAWDVHKDVMMQKGFAMRVKDYTFSAVMFTARKLGITALEAWNRADLKYRAERIAGYIATPENSTLEQRQIIEGLDTVYVNVR